MTKEWNLSYEKNKVFVEFAQKILEYGIADVEMEDELTLLHDKLDKVDKEFIRQLKEESKSDGTFLIISIEKLDKLAGEKLK